MVPRSRRHLLRSAVIAAVPLAGCLSKLSTGDATSRTDRIRRPNCEYATRPPAEAYESDEVEPAPYPDPPEHPVSTSWVVEYERAYRRNEALGEHEVQFWSGLMVSETEREERPHGVVVRVTYTYGLTTDEAVIDSPPVTAAYYVDERGALRATESGGGGEPATDLDPADVGTPVVCF